MGLRLPIDSIKVRLIVVQICNLVISLSIIILIASFPHGQLPSSNMGSGSSGLIPMFLLFMVIFMMLSFITTKIILIPIKNLTNQVRYLVKTGHLSDIEMSRYPELRGLVQAAVEVMKSAEREKSMALLIKSAASFRAETGRHDPLTGAYNRDFLENYLPAEFSRAKILRQPLSIIMLDVDHFKHYNDVNGHPEGDVALREITEIIRKNTRNFDICIRYGGEEFLVILPRTPLSQATKIARRIRKTVEGYNFPNQDKQPEGNLTISIGLACFPEHADKPDSLIKRADQALYHSKESGRNNVTVYGASDSEK